MRTRLALLAATFLIGVRADAGTPVAISEGGAPSIANVAYGDHARQTLDLYKARGDAPTPVLFFIHGGAWMTGDKAKPDLLEPCLHAGISVVSINYRLLTDAGTLTPPVRAPLEDAARALQFVRSKAGEWQLDPTRIAGCGGSAGGFTALWLALSPDRAVATGDPVARQTTRLSCVLAFVPQTTLDPKLMREWVPNMDYGSLAFGLPTFDAFLASRDRLLPQIEAYSPLSVAARGAPPVYLFYGAAPAMGSPQVDPPHSANQAVPLVDRLRMLGVDVQLHYPNAPGVRHLNVLDFLIEHLRPKPAGPAVPRS